MKGRWAIALCIFLVAFAANFAIPAFDTHSEQDNCTFGEVSNADYRGYLLRARAQFILTPSLYLAGDAFARQLEKVFTNLSRGKVRIYEKLAIVHAMLRAVGAEYRNADANRPGRSLSDPFAEAMSVSETVSFNYALDVNRLWIFSPWQREAWVVVSLAGPRYRQPPGPFYPKEIGALGFIVHPPDPKMWPAEYEIHRDGACPPIPPVDLADKFSTHRQTEVPPNAH
jgi:hypothetical protein